MDRLTLLRTATGRLLRQVHTHRQTLYTARRWFIEQGDDKADPDLIVSLNATARELGYLLSRLKHRQAALDELAARLAQPKPVEPEDPRDYVTGADLSALDEYLSRRQTTRANNQPGKTTTTGTPTATCSAPAHAPHQGHAGGNECPSTPSTLSPPQISHAPHTTPQRHPQ